MKRQKIDCSGVGEACGGGGEVDIAAAQVVTGDENRSARGKSIGGTCDAVPGQRVPLAVM